MSPLGTPEDRAYENSAFIPGAEGFSRRWADAAAAFRAGSNAELDVAYGLTPRERLDIFRPTGEPRGLMMFIHGGYWMAFDKSYWSHLAAGPLAHGYAVAIPSYPLCPSVRITAIVAAVCAAAGEAAKRVAGPMVVAGHSAGGHLASRLACADAPVDPDVSERLRRVVAVSALTDLRPLMATSMNETLHLSAQEARAQSPALCDPLPHVELVAWVGDGERPQLRRQSRILALMWEGLARSVRHVEAQDRHHFDVIEDFVDPASPLTEATVAPET